MKDLVDPEEPAMIARCLQGDHDAWVRFFEKHRYLIRSVIRRDKWGFARHEHEDLYQEVSAEIVKSLKNFEPRGSLRSWVFTIAARGCIARLKARIKAPIDHSDSLDCVADVQGQTGVHVLPSNGQTPEEIASRNQGMRLLQAAIASLDESCKQLIRYRFFEDMPFRELSEMMDVKENTLTVQLRRCLDRARSLLAAGSFSWKPAPDQTSQNT
jgi:RNA polymerase sigma-70 factor, ECF subfamily